MQLFRILPVLFCWLLFSLCHSPVRQEPVKVINNGVEIAYTSCGDADTTLLFVHGWCINKEYWQPQLDFFCPQYKVVAIDLPGFGASGKNKSDWSFDAYTSDIKAVIEQLQLKNVVLIGHSMSGDILLLADNAYPELLTAIAGIDNLHVPGSPMTDEQQQQAGTFFSLLSNEYDSTVEKYMLPTLFQPSTPESVVNRVRNDVMATDSSISIQVLSSMYTVAQQEQQLMQGLSHKLYLINSDVAPVAADSLNKYCTKGFEVFTVHATGHYPMIEKPGEFNTALQKVMAAIATGN